ncbi:MAG: Gfo/Idh/MocA family oxidoreductase [Gemmataceae bacterium]|nr:Gfo/Idh/MocA family oxidoreductase [Gemmataceae bacterium]
MSDGAVSRREALATGAVLLGGAAAQRTPVYVPPPPGKKPGWALVGLGKLTIEELLPAFARCEKSRVAALVSGVPEKAKALAARYGVPEKHIYDYEAFDRVKDNPDVDVVYVVLPNSLHAEYTVRAAKAGKHVFCEKPMAPTTKECREMIAACRAANVRLMIAYRLHHEPHHLRATDLARGKELGVQLVIADLTQQVPPGTWRTDRKMGGGGPVPDIGIYCLNAARYLTGEEPAAVRATTFTPKDDLRFGDVEQRCLFTLSFPSGAQANCSCDYGLDDVSQFTMIGPDGSARMDNAFRYRGLKMTVTQRGVQRVTELAQIDQFAAEIDLFSQCILENKPHKTPGEHGLQDVTDIEAIYEAARSGRPVKLNS